MLPDLLTELHLLADPKKAQILQGFFKTAPGQYGEGDIFLGINIPTLKNLAKKYKDLSQNDIETLLASTIHEERYMGLAIIRFNFEKSKDELKKSQLFELSYKNMFAMNNWDLVDTFIPYVWGEYFFSRDKTLLYQFAQSSNIWERRIAILTTFYFIRQKEFTHTLKISEVLLCDKHDLIHKATGWMLREMGKKDLSSLYGFLDLHHKIMPRTMLRYAIEKLDEEKRKYYMKK